MVTALVNKIAEMISFRKYRWVHFFGAAFVLFALLFSVIVIRYSPREVPLLMRHAGIFFADLKVVALFLFAWTALYTLFYINIKKVIHDRVSMRIIVFWVMLVIVILFITPPFFSSDLYGYISRSVIANVHDASPYIVSPAELGYSDVVSWPQQVWVYGPLFTTISVGLTKIVGSNVLANIIAFRLVSAFLFMIAGWLVYRILGKTAPEWQRAGTALFLTNPFFLIEIVHSAHNDIFMMISVLLFVWWVVTRQYVRSVAALTAGFLVKFSTAILYPIVGLFILNQSKRKTWREILLSIAVVGILVVGAYAPWHIFNANIANLGRAFITDNNLTLPQAMLVAGLEGVHRVIPSFEVNLITVRMAYLFTFLVLYALLLFWPGLQKEDTFIKRSFWMLMIFLFLLGGKFNIWYILWFAPLVLLVRDRRYHGLIILLTAYGFLYYATLSVFFPNILFSVGIILYFLVIQFNTTDKFFRKKANIEPGI